MNWIRAFKLHSFAQYFCIFGVLLFMGIPNQARAECSATARKKVDACKDPKYEDKNFQECTTAKNECAAPGTNPTTTTTTTPINECTSAISAAESAKRDFNRQCGQAGLGGNCLSKMQACDKAGESDEYISDDDFLRALGQQVGVKTTNMSSKCPKYSGQGFFERKDKYERDLDDVNDKLGDLKEDLAELNDNFSKDMQEIQEELQEQQDALKKQALETKERQRDRAAEMAKTASEVASMIRKKHTENLQLRTQIAEIYRSKNSSLIAMTENAAKRACMKKVKELRKEYQSVKAGSVSTSFAKASLMKKELNDTFNECMSQFDVQRAALITQTEEKVQAIQMQINNNQSDIDDANQQLSSMNAQETEAKKDEEQAKTDAANAYQEKLKRSMARMESLAKTTQEKANALQEKQEYYKKKSVGISNSLNSLGPVPEDETSNVKMSEVQGDYDTYKSAVERVMETKDPQGNQCNYNYCVLGSEFCKSNSSKKSAGSKSSKGSK